MAAGGMTVKMISYAKSYAKKLRQIYRFYLADNPAVMFATTKQTTNSPLLLSEAGLTQDLSNSLERQVGVDDPGLAVTDEFNAFVRDSDFLIT